MSVPARVTPEPASGDGLRETTAARPPVFIIGGSRTGSEMLKTMLCRGSEQDFVNELFLLCPRWLHPDLRSTIDRHVGSLDATDALDRLLDFLYSGIPYGWIWENAGQQLDRSLLREALQGRRLTLATIFDAIMHTHAAMRGKSRIGAKFPMHYSQTPLLLEWYPDCRLVHTVREPRAVYASQAAKYLVPEASRPRRWWERARQFVHINIQTSWTARLHRQLCGHENYRLVRYEDVIAHPRRELGRLCDFLELTYSDDMLQPNRYGSSFGNAPADHGVSRDSLERWRRELRPATASLIKLLHPLARRRFGYTDKGGVG